MKRLVILTTLFLAASTLAAQSATQPVDPTEPKSSAEASPAPAQAQASPAQAQAQASPAPAQTQAADWFWGKPIYEVQWSGLIHADKRELDSTVKSYIGKAFTEDLWMELQSKLYELDWFEKIDQIGRASCRERV
jgi:hypothetical protein